MDIPAMTMTSDEADDEPPNSHLFDPVLGLYALSQDTRDYLFEISDGEGQESRSRGHFREEFFPGVTPGEWDDWRWQIRHSFRSLKGISRILQLQDTEREAFSLVNGNKGLPFAVTPYFVSLFFDKGPSNSLRRTVIPTIYETRRSPGESDDPLGEDSDSPVLGIVHRYPDRVLFLVTSFCSTYCRYCTRSRMAGRPGHRQSNRGLWERGIAYIEANKAVRDVLISGGDPLTLPDHAIEWLLSQIRRIPHVEIIRIGTKVPAVLPQKIDASLVKMLKKYHPLWMSLHFTHPDEITREAAYACGLLADAGIPLGSQTVLLRNINDSVETMKLLVHKLLKIRVRPYYLYQCDPISGSYHFRTSVKKGIEIIRGLRGYTSGYAVPHYVIDAPGGGGKIPLLPEYVVGRDGDDILLQNYEGNIYRYPDHCGTGDIYRQSYQS
jgi:lysine 2,3-aminomutase